MNYPNLFKPIQLGNVFFRNRIFASPTGYQNLDGTGYLNDGAAPYYERKAQGGAASVATFEGIVDGKFGKGGATHICLDTPGIHVGLARIAYAIASHGAVPTMELQHSGMFANRDLSFFGAEAKGIAYGPVECDLDGRHILAMDEAMIERTIRKFADGAAVAKKAGFGMVLVHAGHGWGLHQFLSPITNTRTDKWGGASAENRCRILVSIIDAIHARCGKGFPVEVRISGSECYAGGYGIETGIEIAKQIDGHADLIHVSAGNHEVAEVFAVTHPSMFLEDGCNVKYAAEIKKHVKTPVATIGALNDPAFCEEIIASNKADIVEMGRQFICDPDFPNKVRSGQEQNVRKCMRCLSCFSQELTHGEPYCALNPEAGKEFEMKWEPRRARFQKKVLIAGGGPGGMQAALTCAERGHSVILCEKNERLGGVLRCEEKVSFKRLLDDYLNQQERLCRENPSIEVRCNTEVTPEYAKQEKADVLIAAIGASPAIPPIPGIECAVTAQQAYEHLENLGEHVLILGAGLVGVELGLHLTANGKKVTLVEMADHVNDGGNFLHMMALQTEIDKVKLEIHFQTKAMEITDKGAYCMTENGKEFFGADSIVCALGMKPRWDETAALYDCAPEFYPIGDCVAATNITNATSTAYGVARDIGKNF